jgi:hypothetical protein
MAYQVNPHKQGIPSFEGIVKALTVWYLVVAICGLRRPETDDQFSTRRKAL